MIGYIYKTTDLISNKIYIGQHKSDRFDESYFGSGKIISNIKKSCKNSGIAYQQRLNVEIIEWCESDDDLNKREIFWINYYNSTNPDIGYNLHRGGLNTISDKNGMYGKHFSNETLQKMHKQKIGRIWITNGKEDMMLSLQDAEACLNQGFYRGRSKGSLKGKIRSKEASEKTSKTLKGRKKSDLQKEKLSNARKNKIFITNGIITKSIDATYLNEYLKQGFKKGRTFKSNPWNKGLSAKTNKKLKEIGQKTHNTRKNTNNYIPWNKGLTKETNKSIAIYSQKISNTLKEKYKN